MSQPMPQFLEHFGQFSAVRLPRANGLRQRSQAVVMVAYSIYLRRLFLAVEAKIDGAIWSFSSGGVVGDLGERMPGAGEAAFDGADGDMQAAGDIAVAHALEHDEIDDVAFLSPQVVDGFEHIPCFEMARLLRLVGSG